MTQGPSTEVQADRASGPPVPAGLVRVTVTSGTRRVDLVLPGAVPVVELLPELARSVGLLDSSTAFGGYTLVTPEGRRLAPDSGLTLQGVDDGGLLTVVAGVDEEAPRVYDDVVEAMTDVVEHDLRPWEPAAGRRTALVAAGLFMALGAVALLIQRGADLATAAAAAVAIALVVGAVVLSRVQEETEAAVSVAWVGCAYAAVAGLLAGPTDGDFFGWTVACAGGGAVLAGLVALVGLGEGKALVIPPIVVGVVFVATGVVVENTTAEADVVLAIALALVVMVGSIFPWLALGATSTTVDQLYSPADITADPDRIDPQRVASDARVAHEILVAITGTVGLLLLLVAPLTVGLGLYGALMALACCVVVMLRTRQYRTGTEVLVGLGSGVVGLAALGVAVLAFEPTWRPTVAVVLAAAGAVLLAVTLLPGSPSVRRGRLGDVLEVVALLAVLPLLVLAIGLFDRVAG